MVVKEAKKILKNHFVLEKPDSKYWVDTNYSMQNLHITIWCYRNLSSHWNYGHNPGIGYRFWFETEADKVMFILKWL